MKYELWGINEHNQHVFLQSFSAASDDEANEKAKKHHELSRCDVRVMKEIGNFEIPRRRLNGIKRI